MSREGEAEAGQLAAEAAVRSLRNCPDGVLILDRAGRVQFANRSAVALFDGGGDTPLAGALWSALWDKPDQSAAEAALKSVARGATSRFIAALRRAPAAVRRLDTLVSPDCDGSGAPSGALVICRDVTDLEAARLATEARERAAAEEATRLRSVAAMLSLTSWETDYRRNLVRRGDALGVREIPLDVLMNRYSPETRAQIWEGMERAGLSGEPYREDVQYTREDGVRGWFRNFCEPIFEGGECVGLRGAAMDISEEVAAQEAIKRAEQRLQLAIELAGMEVFELDFERQSLMQSGSWKTILRDPLREEDVWPDPFQTVDPRDQARVRAAWTEALETRTPFRSEFRVHGRDGQEAWVYCAAEIQQEDERPKRVVAALLDITERKRHELEILQTMAKMREHEAQQKLLLDELNHRVKNTLSAVQSIAVQTLGGGLDLPEARELFIARLLALSATHNLLVKQAWTSASFRELVEIALKPYGHAWRYAGADLRLDPNYAVSLGMALHELATNAIKHGAWRASGHVNIVTTVEAGRAQISWQESGGPPVSLPTRRGFGSRLLQRGVPGELGGSAALEFPPEGLVYRIQTALTARLGVASCEGGSAS